MRPVVPKMALLQVSHSYNLILSIMFPFVKPIFMHSTLANSYTGDSGSEEKSSSDASEREVSSQETASEGKQFNHPNLIVLKK